MFPRCGIKLAQACLLCWAALAWAEAPEIASNGIVNAAANAPLGLIDGAIARGAALTIRGELFGESPSDVSVKLSGKVGEKSLQILSVDNSTLTVRVPRDAPLGPASLSVAVGRERSAPYPVKVVAAQFGIYAINSKGWGPGRIQNLLGQGRQPNGVSNAANLGQTLRLLGTGLGDAKTPAVFVGGRAAKLLTARASPDGDEIIFQLPEDAPQGCFVPVQVRSAGSLPSNTVTVSIRKGGGACLEAQYFPFAGWPMSTFGIVTITRTAQDQSGVPPIADEMAGWFGRLPALDRLNPYFLLPPPGACTSEAEPWKGEFVPATLISLLASRAGTQALRAGNELDVDDGKTVRKVPSYRGAQGVFERELSDLFGRPDRLLNLLSPTILHVSGKGGPDVGRFRFAIEGPQPFEVHSAMETLRRGHALRLEWTSLGSGRIAIVFANFVDDATGSRGMCYCVAKPGADGLTIPASTLAYFPEATSSTRVALTVAAWPLRPVTFQASGLDHAFAVSVFMQHAAVGPRPSSFRERN